MALSEMLTVGEGLLPPPRGENPNKLKDKLATSILDKWWKIGESTPIEERGQVGIVYISTYLDLGEEVAESFAKLSMRAFSLVGQAQRQIVQENTDLFWDRICELFPTLHTPEEIAYLTSGDSLTRRNCVLRFMKTFEAFDLTQEPSRILRDLTRNEGT